MNETFDYIVKKYNLNIGNQYIVEIPNMGRNDLAKLFAELNFTKGAEIGVWKGEYSNILCNANPNLHLYGVDPWITEAYDERERQTAVDIGQREFNGIYRMALRVLDPHIKKGNYTIVKKGSMEALTDFEDNSLDFVYIDANHDFVNFANDLHHWLKKVKPGGIMSGHDYAYFSYKKFNHVKRVLIPYARCYRMIPLFIVGAEEYQEGIIRDKYRSWFWVKI